MKITIDLPDVTLSTKQKRAIVRYLNGSKWTMQYARINELADQHDFNLLVGGDPAFQAAIASALLSLLTKVVETTESWLP